MDFLPSLPLAANQLVWAGVLLLFGLIGGELFARWLRLPRIVGYVVTGMVLGPGGAGLVGRPVLGDLRLFVDISVGLILFELGQRLDLRWLRANPKLLVSALAESGLTFLLVYAALRALEVGALTAAVSGFVGIATSPAVVLRVSTELRAQGQVTERLLLLVAINSAIAALALTMLLASLHMESGSGWNMALHPFYVIGGSLLLAWVAARLAFLLGALVGKGQERQFSLVIALVLATVGAAIVLKLSVLLSLLALGAMVRNLDREHALLPLDLGVAGQLFFVVLFVFTGAVTDVSALLAAPLLALAFLAARGAAKVVGAMTLVWPGEFGAARAGLVGVGMLPMSSVAVMMAQDTVALFPDFGEGLAQVVLAAAVILEILGPIATQWALLRAGDGRLGE